MKDIPVILRKEDKVLFCGYPETIRIFSKGGYREAELMVLTGTARLGRGKRDRVFQSPKLSYGDILRGVLGDTPDAAYIMTGQDRKTGTPFFQYRETDWEFLTRVCSRLRLPLVADSGLPDPRFYIGLRRGSLQELPEDCSYTLSFDGERFYGLLKKGLDVARDDFFCYHVTTGRNLDLGERVCIDGKERSVCRKEMRLRDGELIFSYCLAGTDYALTNELINTDMVGVTLTGSVTNRSGETCELALNIDPGQAGGYPYPFAPRTGNLMYCMPREGTRVCLNLGNGEEAGARVLDCIRTNGEECDGTGVPAEKHFQSEHGKGMELHPENMGLYSGQLGRLCLDDLTGASLTSGKNLILYAKGDIRLDSGKVIDMETLSGIFTEALAAATSSMCVNGRFDYLSAGTLLKGSTYLRYDPFDDAPKEGKFDWGGFFNNLAFGLKVAAVFAAFALAAITAGAAAIVVGAFVGAAIGAFATTVRISVEDFNSGNVRSESDARWEIGIATVSGAITGALGASQQFGRLTLGAINTLLNASGRTILFMATEDMTPSEALKCAFDPRVLVIDFVVGVVISYVVDGILGFLSGKGSSLPENDAGRLYSVDPSMFPDDEMAGVLQNGEYINNPTATNINDYISEGSNYLGNKNMNGQYMYVIDTEGNIIIGTRGGQRMPHPTLIGGSNPLVQAAGIIEIRGGKIYSINNASGHYKPGNECLNVIIDFFSELPQNIFSKDFIGYLPFGK